MIPYIWVNPNETYNGLDDYNNNISDDVNGASFFNGVNSGDVTDRLGHGTLVNGVISATTVNSSVQLIQCRFIDTSIYGLMSDALMCIN